MKNSTGFIEATIWSLVIRVVHDFCGRALFISGILFFVVAQSRMATGTIKGKVVDEDAKDESPGAKATIRGISIGTSSLAGFGWRPHFENVKILRFGSICRETAQILELGICHPTSRAFPLAIGAH